MPEGIGVSPGIAIGIAAIKNAPVQTESKVSVGEPEQELVRLESAIEKCRSNFLELNRNAKLTMGEEAAAVFDAHAMILKDPALIEGIKAEIMQGNSAEYAAKTVGEHFAQMFLQMDDEYFKERAEDVRDVISQLLGRLRGYDITENIAYESPTILVADELSPSEMARMDHESVVGIILERGGRTSHVAVMAKSMSIPVVVLEEACKMAEDGMTIAMNGEDGTVLFDPAAEPLETLRLGKERQERLRHAYQRMVGVGTSDRTGKHIRLLGNVGGLADVNEVLAQDGEGVGLFRTEFLYMNQDDLPGEEQQFAVYREVAQRMSGCPVIIRTFDIGGDKDASSLQLPKEDNPLLGYRGIRICLRQISLFKTQLRAILRAGAFGNIKLMFPMISCVEELEQALAILAEVKEELREEQEPFNEQMETGIMIEVPAAAVLSDHLASRVDFFSIGSNDLTQYVTAADRGNNRVENLYNPLNPAVLRLIQFTVESAHKAGIWVGVCGEIASSYKIMPLLLGMGVDELSVAAGTLLRTRYLISMLSHSELAETAQKALSLPSAATVEKLIEEAYGKDLKALI